MRNLWVTPAVVLCALAATATAQIRPVTGPGSIQTPGSYQLVRNIRGSITINSDDVTLDLNGYSITGPTGLASKGIQVTSAAGVEIFGGSISNFGIGVEVNNSANVRLHDLRIRATDLAVPAPPPEIGIMVVNSPNVVVEDNTVWNVGLGIFVRGSRSLGARVMNNTVTAGSNGLLGICFNPAPDDMNGPRGGFVSGNVIAGFNGGVNLSDLSKANIISGNSIAYKSTAVTFADESNIDMDNISVQLP